MTAQHAAPRSVLRRSLPWIGMGLAIVLLITVAGGYVVYRRLSGNIQHQAIHIPGARPARIPGHSQNILLMGSDTRDFAGGAKFGSEITGARSDTTILVHLYADGGKAVLVSIPRDTYVRVPRCDLPGGGVSQPQWNKFNAAFSIGGPSCTIATVEHLTKLHIDHYVVVNFAGFQRMVDALGGVTVCLSHDINDPHRYVAGHWIGSGLVVKAGDVKFKGSGALAFVRARYGVGDGSDLGRIRNQQVFMASMIRKATSMGLILKPWKLYSFLNAATKSIETDPGFGLQQIRDLAGRLHGLKPGKVALLTVPLSNTNAYVPIGGIPASVVYWDRPQATALWAALRADKPLPRLGTKRPTPSSTAAPTPTPSPSLDVVTASRDRCTA